MRGNTVPITPPRKLEIGFNPVLLCTNGLTVLCMCQDIDAFPPSATPMDYLDELLLLHMEGNNRRLILQSLDANDCERN